MDQNHFNTDEAVRKSGSHLTLAERGMIQALHKKGMSLLARAIAAAFLDMLPNVDRKPTRRTASDLNALQD